MRAGPVILIMGADIDTEKGEVCIIDHNGHAALATMGTRIAIANTLSADSQLAVLINSTTGKN